MKLFNLIAKGLYLFLQWYFGTEMVKDFMKEIQEYINEKTAAAKLPIDNEELEKDSKE